MSSNLNLADDWELRIRHPDIFRHSNDDEILFLISKMSNLVHPLMPFQEYATTGCIVLARKYRLDFRSWFLKLYEENKFVKCSMREFKALERMFTFNIDAKVIFLRFKNPNFL